MNLTPLAVKLSMLAVIVLVADFLQDVPIHNPWFVVFVVWWIFSSITTGMPEPENRGVGESRGLFSSPFYLWAYRTMHIMTQSGTSYFGSRRIWPNARADDHAKREGEEGKGK